KPVGPVGHAAAAHFRAAVKSGELAPFLEVELPGKAHVVAKEEVIDRPSLERAVELPASLFHAGLAARTRTGATLVVLCSEKTGKRTLLGFDAQVVEAEGAGALRVKLGDPIDALEVARPRGRVAALRRARLRRGETTDRRQRRREPRT